jgi:hypothetical protein
MLDTMETQQTQLNQVEEKVAGLLETKTTATRELWELERATDAPPELTVRGKLNQLVRAYCRATNVEHADVWGRLYHALFYRCSFNAQQRARNRGRSALDCVDEAGLLPELFAIASEVLVF